MWHTQALLQRQFQLMAVLLHRLIQEAAGRSPSSVALLHKSQEFSYQQLGEDLGLVASGLVSLGLAPNERVAVSLPKQYETVLGLFGAAAAGGVFVPINPVLKPEQVGYILRDCNVRVLITAQARANLLLDEFAKSHDLRHLVLVDGPTEELSVPSSLNCLSWQDLLDAASEASLPHRRIDADLASILYTSGSTGRPKGVVLSHRNMVAGAESVAEYLKNTRDDRILAVLPFSFDYGLSQLTTAFRVGASAVLMDYLLPRDVIRALDRYEVTGLAAVPPLWNQLANLEWPDAVVDRLRYITNSGGAMPLKTTEALRRALPRTDFVWMYGLTEAFRSTYLPPELNAERPNSMGKAIPNAEILVVRDDGSECEPGEPGELVHRGALVAQGYWNDEEKTAERFKPAPGQPRELPNPEIAVWSGDQVRRDKGGLLYFVSRKDEMIKTSGYRVSPTEIEEVVYGAGGITHAIALGVPHPMLGQAVVLIVQLADSSLTEEAILQHCKQHLPAYMLPAQIFLRDNLPQNANGKIDRKSLSDEYQGTFSETI